MIRHFSEPEKIFQAKQSALEKIEGIGTIKANSIKRFNDFSKAGEEIKLIEKFKLRILFITIRIMPRDY